MTKDFWGKSPYMERDACEWLVKRKIKAWGGDFPCDYLLRYGVTEPGRVAKLPREEHTTHAVFFPAGIIQFEYIVKKQGGKMMDEKKMETLKKRIEKEKEYFNLNRSEKGKVDGKRDAYDFSYADFMKYREILKKYADDGLDDITGEEIELKELYINSKSKRKKKSFNINIEHCEDAKDLKGLYNITVTEEAKRDPLDEIKEDKQHHYLKGWLNGIFKIWKVLGL